MIQINRISKVTILMTILVLFFSVLFAYNGIENLGNEDRFTLTQDEIDGLLLMREEEKLARDMYLKLYDIWELEIFKNIANSEESHTNAVKKLLDKYGIEDPMNVDEFGIFVDQELQELFDSLVEKGSKSLLDALLVGATVEDLDIYDLQQLKEMTDKEDIIRVYNNLEKGSRNHMRSFMKLIEEQGGEYQAQFISDEELKLILSTEMERGPYNENWTQNLLLDINEDDNNLEEESFLEKEEVMLI
ncbi:MAG: DUF2202 domain-containing protein [Candidatus Woesearchaeota archaeon]